MLRFIGSVLVIVWMWIVRVCRAITGKRGKKDPPQNVGVQPQSEWTTEWDGWEGVTVEQKDPQLPIATQEEPPDLFRDMQPHLQKTKKIKLNIRHQDGGPNLQQFAFDPKYSTTASSELLDWPDDEGKDNNEEGWEKEDLPELLRQSRQTLRKQRQEAMEQQRQHPKNGISGTRSLGATKVT